ncbi:hypothetical protein BU17DRAFT_63175 [Hysterangium stoloniferum]|nr:hypothetical protein BU17DRAFT_63175 [Hysterangium stoloniferum]
MSTNSIITLYDMATRKGDPAGWNMMGLKARYALSFKGVEFQTVWLEYPEMEPTMRRIGAAPTGSRPDGSPFFTIPVISDPIHRTPKGEATVISDSWKIAEHLDRHYPAPGLLFPDGTKALQSLFLDYANTKIAAHIRLISMSVAVLWLNDESATYSRKQVEATYGAKIEELCPRGSEKWDHSWTVLQKRFSDLAAHQDKNGPESTFILGAQVTFADFILLAMLEQLVLTAPDEWKQKVEHWDNGRWKKLRDGCSAWNIRPDNRFQLGGAHLP